MRNVLNIEARKIVIPEGRMRPVNAAWVEKLRDSIEKGQLLLPLVVGVPNDDKLWPLVDGAHRPAALKKLKYRLVPCFSMRGDKDMHRLAEIEANLLNSPLARLERLEHQVERKRLCDEIYGTTKRGGDRRSERFQSDNVVTLKSPLLSDAHAESIGMGKRSMYRAIRFCKRLSAEERNRLKGTSVENCDKDLFAIADIGDIQKRTAARSRTPKDPRPPCMKRSVAQDLPRSRNEEGNRARVFFQKIACRTCYARVAIKSWEEL